MLKGLIKELSKYFLGFLIFGLIVLFVYIIRSFSLSNAEIGFIGAILGGLIGGSLTLIGVNVTLENQRNEKFIDLYPTRKLFLDKLLKDTGKVVSKLNEPLTENGKLQYYFSKCEQIKHENFQEHIVNSTIVNGMAYAVANKIYKEVKFLKGCLTSLEFTEEISDIEDLKICEVLNDKVRRFKDSLNELKVNISIIEKEINDLDSKYKKLTGM